MVKGLDVFRAWFANYPDQYILIGGTAATLAMEEAGLDFRATKDLDVVLHVEALTPAFGETFWRFIEAGGYEIRQASDTGKPAFYRFQKPTDHRFPVMVELFSRAPDSLRPIENGQLTPIPFDEAVSSLSAILLDDVAWLDLSTRREQGEQVDARSIRKHANDILRLSQLLTPSTRIPLEAKIADDMKRFLDAAAADDSLDPKALGLGRTTLTDFLGRIAQAYGLKETQEG